MDEHHGSIKLLTTQSTEPERKGNALASPQAREKLRPKSRRQDPRWRLLSINMPNALSIAMTCAFGNWRLSQALP
jgi:hypothetical protein